MIRISLNNEKQELADAVSVAQLLEQQGFDVERVAVAINMTFVSRSAYENTMIQDADEVDVLSAVQGG